MTKMIHLGHRVLFGLATGGAGALYAAPLIALSDPFADDSIMILFAFIGACIAGVASMGGFGHHGGKGYALATVTAILMTLAAAEVGSLLSQIMDSPTRQLFGLGLMFLVFAGSTGVSLIFWIISMFGLHLLARHMRSRERTSDVPDIFD